MTPVLAALAACLGTAKLQIPVASVEDEFVGGALAAISFEADGDVTTTTVAGGAVDAGDWIILKGAANGAYTVRADIVSGTVSEGTTGEDLALTETRSWTRTSSSGTETVVLTISLKLGSAVLATKNVTLKATAL